MPGDEGRPITGNQIRVSEHPAVDADGIGHHDLSIGIAEVALTGNQGDRFRREGGLASSIEGLELLAQCPRFAGIALDAF